MLTLACHAVAMGITADDVLATTILHDAVEDTASLLRGQGDFARQGDVSGEKVLKQMDQIRNAVKRREGG